MIFSSILFPNGSVGSPRESFESPACFLDLNLDQVIDAITIGKQEYNLKSFFFNSLRDIDVIQYRHGVMQDLENPTLMECIKTFAQNMHTMREHLAMAQKLHNKYQKERWFLDTVALYCEYVQGLAQGLAISHCTSHGFLAFREYVDAYEKSDQFVKLLAETKNVQAILDQVHYCLEIKGNTIRVRKYDSEVDYAKDVNDTFAKFRQDHGKNYSVQFSLSSEMNHVEEEILALVVRLYPDTFLILDHYCLQYRDYLDEVLRVFDREVQFYVAYLDYIAMFKRKGLNFCYPQISDQNKEVYVDEGFDVALAKKLMNENESIVCNDFSLRDQERILVISGPNQGGKTTFARMFGQLHYLASLGCPVPGKKARLFLFDQLFTHFEKEENVKEYHGRLEDDLIRIHGILLQATPNSIIIMNEIFTSTTLQDAILLSKKIMDKIIQLDLLCICVTFIDELVLLSQSIVSMISTIVFENPDLRTFKVVRRPANGRSYAMSIAEKYRLTYGSLKERIQR